jgi:uncharacterized membrane protein
MNEIVRLHIIVGSVLLFVSFLMKLWPPKKINSIYGYRTPRSTKSQGAWDEANTYSADLLMWTGISTIVVQAISYFAVDGHTSILIALGYYVACVLISIILTEARLKGKGY